MRFNKLFEEILDDQQKYLFKDKKYNIYLLK